MEPCFGWTLSVAVPVADAEWVGSERVGSEAGGTSAEITLSARGGT